MNVHSAFCLKAEIWCLNEVCRQLGAFGLVALADSDMQKCSQQFYVGKEASVNFYSEDLNNINGHAKHHYIGK